MAMSVDGIFSHITKNAAVLLVDVNVITSLWCSYETRHMYAIGWTLDHSIL